MYPLSAVDSETSLIHTSVIQLPHLSSSVCRNTYYIHNDPTVHYTTAPSFIQFPHLSQYFLWELMCNNPTVHHITAPSDIQLPHLQQQCLWEYIHNDPTVHYTTAPSYIQFPHFIRTVIHNRCVWISEV